MSLWHGLTSWKTMEWSQTFYLVSRCFKQLWTYLYRCMYMLYFVSRKTGKFLDISAESGACVQGCGYGGFRCSVTWVSFGAFWRRLAATWRVSPCWSSDDHLTHLASSTWYTWINFGSIILQPTLHTDVQNIYFISGTCLHCIHVTVVVEVLEKFIAEAWPACYTAKCTKMSRFAGTLQGVKIELWYIFMTFGERDEDDEDIPLVNKY